VPGEPAKPKFQAAYNPAPISTEKTVSQTPPADREVRGWKRDEEPNAPKARPVSEESLPASSDELQGLLSQFDNPIKEESRIEQQEPNVQPKSVAPLIVSTPKPVMQSPTPVARTTFTPKPAAPHSSFKSSDKTASDDKKNSLKSALAKAMELAKQSAVTAPTPPQAPKESRPEPVIIPEGQSFLKLSSLTSPQKQDDEEDDSNLEEDSKQDSVVPPPPVSPQSNTGPSFVSRTPKEVPEDILRQVLE
jgi:hypothetical protein